MHRRKQQRPRLRLFKKPRKNRLTITKTSVIVGSVAIPRALDGTMLDFLQQRRNVGENFEIDYLGKKCLYSWKGELIAVQFNKKWKKLSEVKAA